MTKKSKIKPKFKKGQVAIMEFYCAGLVSEEEHEVTNVRGDIITLDTDEDPKQRKKFHASTGACINDTNWGGCSRRLKIT